MLLALPSAAQVKIGYFSYDAALKAIPKYQEVQQDIDKLRQQYDAETKRSEEEFNAKYEEFLDSYNTYAPSIRRKRQIELQTLMASNVQFRNEAQRLLKEAEDKAMAPLHTYLKEILAALAKEHGYAIMLNTDANACPFIDPSMSENINNLVIQALK